MVYGKEDFLEQPFGTVQPEKFFLKVSHAWRVLAYGKDSFLRQPYAPLKSQKPFLHPISPITYEKSFIWRADFFFFGFAFAFFWASEATKPADFFFEVTTRIS
jgi:hypothetical protein